MIRNLAFVAFVLGAGTCQATILSQLTLTNTTATEPTSVQLGIFQALGDVQFGFTQSPFVANTDYYMTPPNNLQYLNYIATHPDEFQHHGSLWFDVQGTGLGNYETHYDRLSENYTESNCATSDGLACSGTLTVAGTPEVYTVPWNQLVMRYDYVPAAGGGYATTMTVTISNVPEPALMALITLSMVGVTFSRRRRR